MKFTKIFLLLFVASVVFNGCGPAKQYVKVDRMPEFPGGFKNLVAYMTQNVQYPEAAMQAGVQGRVVVSFIVETDGSITDCHVSQSLSPSCDAEALRVVKAMPRWIPGMDKGKPIRVMFNLPVSFKFSNDEDY